MHSTALFDYASLSDRDRAAILDTVGEHTSLEAVLKWLRGRTPPQDVEDVLTQDEYTHDVIVRFDTDHYLVYDTS